MTPNPILRALSTLNRHGVRYLLMGGQACVFYGAAEFSRDADIALLAEPENLRHLSRALDELEAECVAVPPFDLAYLRRGHAVHFRCRHPEADGIRIDAMSVMRGVCAFDQLWERRTTVQVGPDLHIDVMSLPDLVQAKKTQRDRDWPMLRRLLEAHYVQHRDEPNTERVRFWLGELRTASLLIDLAAERPDDLSAVQKGRPLLAFAASGDEQGLTAALAAEEQKIREVDRAYWAPLRKELEELRRRREPDRP